MDIINLISADKTNIVSLINDLQAQKVIGCNINRIETLIKSLTDNIFFLLESPYIDEHFRDSYYFYYAEKFLEYERNSIRVHIFNECVGVENFFDKKDAYLGYFIVRPLKMCPLGHSFISPKAFKNHSFICCLTKNTVNILGNKFNAYAFPHVVQDSETQTCAESSLWSLLSYFGTKYKEYNPFKPSEIIEKLNSFAGHRTLPSKGLLLEELTACLNSCGQNCLVYCLNQNDKKDVENNFRLMRIYIESGMPFVVALRNEKAGHAVLAIGHEELNIETLLEYQRTTGETWMEVSSFDKRLVFVDDNCIPYVSDSCEKPALRYNSFLNDMKISAFIVPFQKHMFIDAQAALDLISAIFNNKKFGLEKIGKTAKQNWITRLLLTTANSFKDSINTDCVMDKNLKEYFIHLSLPKFIWICEIYSTESYAENKCVGIVIIDSTGNKMDCNSVLLYYLNDNIIINNGKVRKDGDEQFNDIAFCKETYRNNLKGEWSQWKI